jgi:SLT domain-containing protein
VSGVRGAFQGVVNSIGNIINGIIGMVNRLIEGINKVRAAANLSAITRIPNVNIPSFAKGGIVDRATLALVGEGGEREYIIPESKMAAASSRYLGGARGESVLPAAGGGGGANQPPVINITTGPVMEMDGKRYVTIEEYQRGIRQTASQIYATLRTPQGRRAVGYA